MSQLRFIFVHGLAGWGSYDEAYRRMPYWGMRGGDILPRLREAGYECYAASVAPTGSAWDRACELYAQLAGARTDYGAAHSAQCRHERFGRDFSSCPLIPEWNADTRLVLLGHSFGGATVRLFAELLARGNAEEAAKADASPLFKGGAGARVHSIVTLASPMNGTTAYDMTADPAFDPASVKTPLWSRLFARAMSRRLTTEKDGRDERDYAGYDMHIDRALQLNEYMPEQPYVYYFSVPCSFTQRSADGTYKPLRGMEPLFAMRSHLMGAYSGVTQGGLTIGDNWRENDGLVNTLSATAPLGARSKPLDRDDIQPGIWNVFPTVRGDHMWPQGGLMHKHDVLPFYTDLLALISSIADRDSKANS